MHVAKQSSWLNRFAWFTAFITLLLICSGGMVTSKGVGLAVPDWPTTFGYNMFLFPVSQWVGGVLFEHTHRLLASTVGLLTLVLAIWLWARETQGPARWLGSAAMFLGVAVLGVRTQPVHIALGLVALLLILLGIAQFVKSSSALRWLGVIALGAVILQGVLGGLRVTMLKDEIGIFHACLAQAFLGLLVFVALLTTSSWRSFPSLTVAPQRLRSLFRLALGTALIIYLQLALGATMRHQHRDLAILDFPTANGAWLPATSSQALAAINASRDARALSNVTSFEIWLQMAHRFGAFLIAVAVIMCALRIWRDAQGVRLLRRLSVWWVVLLVFQLTLGAWTIWSNKAADIATAHVAVGALMLSFGVSIAAICWRIMRKQQSPAANVPSRPARAAVT
jgi:cytochrome c oxidase assembly protein subunit 15